MQTRPKAAKIGCSPATLHEWVKKTEIDSGKRAGLPSDAAEKMTALERENRERRQANDFAQSFCLFRDGPYRRMQAFACRVRGSSTAPSNDDLVH